MGDTHKVSENDVAAAEGKQKKPTETKPVSATELINLIEKKQKLSQVYDALEERGYDPKRQICGYLLTGDPTYITTNRGVRDIIRNMERFDIIDLILNDFFKFKVK